MNAAAPAKPLGRSASPPLLCAGGGGAYADGVGAGARAAGAVACGVGPAKEATCGAGTMLSMWNSGPGALVQAFSAAAWLGSAQASTAGSRGTSGSSCTTRENTQDWTSSLVGWLALEDALARGAYWEASSAAQEVHALACVVHARCSAVTLKDTTGHTNCADEGEGAGVSGVAAAATIATLPAATMLSTAISTLAAIAE